MEGREILKPLLDEKLRRIKEAAEGQTKQMIHDLVE